MGISGQSACKLLHSQGACVSVYDDENRFSNIFNYVKEPLLEKFDLVVVSPGIKVIGNPIITHFLVTGTLVISELDLGYLFTKGKLLGPRAVKEGYLKFFIPGYHSELCH